MKRIIALVAGAIVFLAGITGATWSAFEDPEYAGNNEITGGYLDLRVNGTDSAVQTFAASNKLPNDSGNGYTTINNAGDIAGYFSVVSSATTNLGGTGGTEFEDGVGDLGGYLYMVIYIDIDESDSFTSGDVGLAANGTTYTYAQGLQWATINTYGGKTWNNAYIMNAGAQDRFRVEWNIPLSTGNNIQGDTVKVNFTYYLTQNQRT